MAANNKTAVSQTNPPAITMKAMTSCETQAVADRFMSFLRYCSRQDEHGERKALHPSRSVASCRMTGNLELSQQRVSPPGGETSERPTRQTSLSQMPLTVCASVEWSGVPCDPGRPGSTDEKEVPKLAGRSELGLSHRFQHVLARAATEANEDAPGRVLLPRLRGRLRA
jgi:hypothetical protein